MFKETIIWLFTFLNFRLKFDMKSFRIYKIKDCVAHKKEESIPILIKARKLMREQGLEKWEAVIEEIKQEKKKLNFFRKSSAANISQTYLYAKRFMFLSPSWQLRIL